MPLGLMSRKFGSIRNRFGISPVPPPASDMMSPLIAACFGDSIAAQHAGVFIVTAYEQTDTTVRLTLSASPVGTLAVNHYVYIVGDTEHLPAAYTGYKKVTASAANYIEFTVSASETIASTAVTSGYVYVHNVSNSAGVGTGRSSTGILHWASVFTENAFVLPASYVFGLGGDTYTADASGGFTGLIDRIRSNWSTMPIKPSLSFFICGTNDANGIAGGTIDFDDFTEDAIACWDFVRNEGAIPCVWTVPSATGSVNANFNLAAGRVNEWIKSYARRYRNIVVLDVAHRWVDPTSATGAARTGYSTDGIHPIPLGAQNLGREVATQLADITRRNSSKPNSRLDKYDATHNPFGCLIAGKDTTLPMFATTFASTELTSVAQTLGGWNLSRDATGTGTITAECLARVDAQPDSGDVIVGNEIKISFANTVVASGIARIDMPAASWLTSLLAAGDNIYAEWEFEWTDFNGVTALRPPSAGVTINYSGGIQFSVIGMYASTGDGDVWPYKGIERTQNITLDSTFVSARVTATIRAPTCTAAVLRIKYFTVRKNAVALPW